MDFSNKIAADLKVGVRQVSATIQLLDDGNTLPFIARYRKEVTGGLDEEQIRVIETSLDTLRSLEERRQTILTSIEEQGQLSEALRGKIPEPKLRFCTGLGGMARPNRALFALRNLVLPP